MNRKISSGCYDSPYRLLLIAVALICVAAFGLPVMSKDFLKTWGFLSILLIICFQDADHRIIPNRCIAAVLILAALFQSPQEISSHLISVMLTGGLLLLAAGLQIMLRKHRKVREKSGEEKTCGFLGGGDVKLLLVLGLFLTPEQTLFMLLFAGILGLITALHSIMRNEKSFPFGPGICAAAVMSLILVQI